MVYDIKTTEYTTRWSVVTLKACFLFYVHQKSDLVRGIQTLKYSTYLLKSLNNFKSTILSLHQHSRNTILMFSNAVIYLIASFNNKVETLATDQKSNLNDKNNIQSSLRIFIYFIAMRPLPQLIPLSSLKKSTNEYKK